MLGDLRDWDGDEGQESVYVNIFVGVFAFEKTVNSFISLEPLMGEGAFLTHTLQQDGDPSSAARRHTLRGERGVTDFHTSDFHE